MKTKNIPFILIFLSLVSSQTIQSQTINYSSWNKLLQKHVNNFGEVNYQAIKTDNQLLQSSLDEFTKNQPETNWSKNETLAYWINAYNAFTIKLISDNYPLKSIKDINNPWDKKFIPIEKNLMSLNEIEHDILRKMNEPRIHFAIVCASKSCPKLLNEAYIPSKIDLQLTVATEEFLSDKTKNSITKDNIKLSKIFKWFSEDFTQNQTLIDFLNQYTSVEISANAKKNFNDYDWNLND